MLCFHIARKPVQSGTYTPTLTGVANVGSSTAYSCQWSRVGSVVTVSGRIDVSATASGLTKIGVSLPVASNLANANECGGCAAVDYSGSEFTAATVSGDATNDRAEVAWVAPGTSAGSIFFSFSYRII